MTTVALIGPDGAGKSSVIPRVQARLGQPVHRIYMGVNLEASRLMLPTTRLAMELKRRRGGRPDMVGATGNAGTDRPAKTPERRGEIVLFDRHFFCDYYANDVIGRRPGRPWTSRLHGRMLERLYPRPDLVVLLDAPADVLFARKGEGTLESLERKRQEYLALASVVDHFVAVDATRDIDAVVDDVIAAIRSIQPNPGARSAAPSPAPSQPTDSPVREDAA